MKLALTTLASLLLALFLAGCGSEVSELPPAQKSAKTAASPPPAPARYKLLDTFNIGDTLVARSLALEAASNTLWVGTSGGVMEIDLATQQPRNTYTRDHGLANEYVFGIFVDSRGNKWFGTNGGGVSRFKDGVWKTFFPMHGLADYWIYTFAEQADGTLWIGTWAGANRYDPKTEQFTTYLKELINEWVYGLDVDAQQRVWFGTEGGVSMFDGSQWQEWSHDDGLGAANSEALPASTNTGLGTRSRHDLSTLRLGSTTYNPNYVFAIKVDDKGQVWAGTWGGGVARYDGKQWHNLTTGDGLAGNIVYSIEQDGEGAYWFGTDGGLSRYDGVNWQTFTTAEGLAGNHVYAIRLTPSGEIWAATQGGVSRLGRQ
ncbi:MAG: regulator [Gammaproteobacteria bacterium]|nr:regulator [Gammaproteobacteria bacterium]